MQLQQILKYSLPNFLPEDTKTDVSLFLDFGNVWGVDYSDTIDESNKLRSSTGVAASWIVTIRANDIYFSDKSFKSLYR